MPTGLVHSAERVAAVHATGLLDTAPEDAFDRLTELARKLLRTPYAFVTLVDDSRAFWKSSAGVDPDHLGERHTPVSASFCQHVIDAARALVVHDARHDPLMADHEWVVTLGLRAWAGYPLRSLDGLPLGTFCVVDTEPRAWTSDELDIIATLAGAVEGEVRMRTVLAENAEVAAATRREMVLRERLAHLGEQLTAAETVDAVATAITELGPGVVGSAIVTLGILDENRRQLGIRGRITSETTLRQRYVTVALGDQLPIVDVVRTKQPIFLPTPAEFVQRYPHLADDLHQLELAALASVPLLHSDGAVLGALTVGWTTPMDFSPNDRAMLRTVALMCAQSLQRAQLGDVRRQFVESLQRELLPALGHVDGWDLAARYLPATAGIGFGGDWYDIVELDDGRTVVVVGDIAGHGIQAAARMSQVRGAINALTRIHGDDLPTVFDEAERILRHLHEGYIATVLLLQVDPSARSMAYICAGHPAPLLVLADGTILVLEGGRRPVLGSGRGRAEVGTAVVPDGSVLLAFTDGLVERRDQSPDVGAAHVADRVKREIGRSSAAGPELEYLADRIIDDLIGNRFATDDVALVLMKPRRSRSRG